MKVGTRFNNKFEIKESNSFLFYLFANFLFNQVHTHNIAEIEYFWQLENSVQSSLGTEDGGNVGQLQNVL